MLSRNRAGQAQGYRYFFNSFLKEKNMARGRKQTEGGKKQL